MEWLAFVGQMMNVDKSSSSYWADEFVICKIQSTSKCMPFSLGLTQKPKGSLNLGVSRQDSERASKQTIDSDLETCEYKQINGSEQSNKISWSLADKLDTKQNRKKNKTINRNGPDQVGISVSERLCKEMSELSLWSSCYFNSFLMLEENIKISVGIIRLDSLELNVRAWDLDDLNWRDKLSECSVGSWRWRITRKCLLVKRARN